MSNDDADDDDGQTVQSYTYGDPRKTGLSSRAIRGY